MAAASDDLLLTIDRGNTTLDCMLSGGTEAPLRRRLDPADVAALRELVAPRQVAAAVASVVSPDGLGAAASAALAEAGVPLLRAGLDLPCPLALDYRDPGTLGVDRWVAALAAQREVGTAVVIDCGTAITVDLVTGEGHFLGGAIAPGLRAMARGLASSAPALPQLAELDVAFPGVPTSSEDAVRCGLWLAFCGAVERLVADIGEAGGLATAPRVLTGGDAERYLRHGRLTCQHVPDLVHRGLRYLWSGRPGRGGTGA